MAVKITITVNDITGTLGAGYTKIKVYRSAEESSGFEEITNAGSMVVLQSGVSEYQFIDGTGTTVHWYRTTFYDPNTPAESSFSSSFNGVFYDSGFPGTSYPEEASFTSEDRVVIDKIRNTVGDPKELTRDYVSATTGTTSSVSADGHTHSFINPRGWPLKIVLDNVEYVSLNEPQVLDYQFITFSGTQISTVSGTLDVWYNHFRYSDAEILRVYNALIPPYPLTEEDMTFELSIICASIELLLRELGLANSTSAVEVDIYQEIRINPKAGLDSRYSLLKLLLQMRQSIMDGIVDDATGVDVFGVLID